MAENPFHELIDTLWNVNVNAVRAFLIAAVELIDTLWNVNFFALLYATLSAIRN